jgi:hypothetical protein
MLGRQVNPGRVQEFMAAMPAWVFYVEFKAGYIYNRLSTMTGILPGEANALVEYVAKQTYHQPPLVNAMYDTELMP